jgi:rhodanese-related sulfurtransferase
MRNNRDIRWGVVFVFAMGCNNYSSFEEMATDMSKGKVWDIESNAAPLDAQWLDVRSLAEWNVSHLSCAQHAEWDGDGFLNEPQLDPDRPIVVYCSVGYRSERAGTYLMEKGFDEVYNLYGGIFKLYNQEVWNVLLGEPLHRMHGYNKRWGKWINKEGVCYDE